MTDKPHFSPELFSFLAELAGNNSKEWLQTHKRRYQEAVQEPLLRFIADFATPLRKISPHFVADARPQGGSMFRIYRDVRFSRDKSPYKTHAAAQFRHRAAGDVHAPGFYLHLEPGNVFAGTGIWQPDASSLARIRAAIVANPRAWKAAAAAPEFLREHALGGESLRRPPQGFDPGHPCIEDLKRKDFVSFAALSEDEALGSDFCERFAALCGAAAPFVGFLCGALELPF